MITWKSDGTRFHAVYGEGKENDFLSQSLIFTASNFYDIELRMQPLPRLGETFEANSLSYRCCR